MKSLSHFLACIGAISLLTVGCERHEFEKTKILHQEHGGGHHDGDDHKGESHEGEHKGDQKHDKDHAGDGDHAKDAEKGKDEEKSEKEEGRDVGI